MTESRPHRRQISVRGLMIGMAVLAILLSGAAWFWQTVHIARIEAWQVNRLGQLKFIGMALGNYHDTHGSFPPAYTVDDQGRPLTSWRVLILPWLEESNLYDQYDQTKPWDSPENLPLAAITPHAYWDDRTPGAVPGETPHLAIVGYGTPINTHGHVDQLKGRPDWWADIMLVHSANHAVPWTKPQDFDPADADELISEIEDRLRANAVLNAITEYRFLTEADRQQILKYAQPPAASPPPSSPPGPHATE